MKQSERYLQEGSHPRVIVEVSTCCRLKPIQQVDAVLATHGKCMGFCLLSTRLQANSTQVSNSFAGL